MTSELLFAPYAPKSMAPDQCIGAKFDRLLEAFELKKSVENRRVVIKMHLGGGNGFSTIHPFFVRKLVKALKAAGAESIFITDLKRDVETAIDRGYTEEVCGCPIVPVCGGDESEFVSFPVEPPFKTMDRIELSKPILDADVLLGGFSESPQATIINAHNSAKISAIIFFIWNLLCYDKEYTIILTY